MLKLVDQFVRLRLIHHDVALQMARVIGSSMARIVVGADRCDRVADRRTDVPGRYGGAASCGRAFCCRRCRASSSTRGSATCRSRLGAAWCVRPERRRGTTRRPSGSPTSSGFTALSQQLDDHELAVIVDRFEATAYDIVGSLGGRVVKMIGDEVMFAVDEAGPRSRSRCRWRRPTTTTSRCPTSASGSRAGPSLEREGDLFGPTVNLASRIVSIAYAASVVVSGRRSTTRWPTTSDSGGGRCAPAT